MTLDVNFCKVVACLDMLFPMSLEYAPETPGHEVFTILVFNSDSIPAQGTTQFISYTGSFRLPCQARSTTFSITSTL